MNRFSKLLIASIVSFIPQSQLYALPMNDHVIKHFKKVICECYFDALQFKGEYENTAYYVNLNQGSIKGFNFNLGRIRFSGVDEGRRSILIKEGCNFDNIKNDEIRILAELNVNEIQQVIDKEISRPAISKRIFNEAKISLSEDTVMVSGSINMKKIPGNPLAMLTDDSFVPFNAKFSITAGSKVEINIISGDVNGQEMTKEVIDMFHNWLNPLWDFQQLDFPCSLLDFKILPNKLMIGATIF